MSDKVVIECAEGETPWETTIRVSAHGGGESEIVGDINTRDENGTVTAKLQDKRGRITIVTVKISAAETRMPTRHGEIVNN